MASYADCTLSKFLGISMFNQIVTRFKAMDRDPSTFLTSPKSALTALVLGILLAGISIVAVYVKINFIFSPIGRYIFWSLFLLTCILFISGSLYTNYRCGNYIVLSFKNVATALFIILFFNYFIVNSACEWVAMLLPNKFAQGVYHVQKSGNSRFITHRLHFRGNYLYLTNTEQTETIRYRDYNPHLKDFNQNDRVIVSFRQNILGRQMVELHDVNRAIFADPYYTPYSG
jgi:hypothetical protein